MFNISKFLFSIKHKYIPLFNNNIGFYKVFYFNVYKKFFSLFYYFGMMLLSNYTVQLLEYGKVCINFGIPKMKEFEMKEFVRFFKKYKKKIFISGAKNKIFFIVVHWERWGKFLLKLGFRDSAEAFCEIVNDLNKELKPPVDPLQYLDSLSQAKPVTKQDKVKEQIKKGKKYEKMKNREIQRLLAQTAKKKKNRHERFQKNKRVFLNFKV